MSLPPHLPVPLMRLIVTYYASYGSALWFGKTNVSLIFLEGNHTTNKTLYVSGINFLTVTSSGDTDSLLIFDVTYFWVGASNSLVVKNLNFDNCYLYCNHYYNSVTDAMRLVMENLNFGNCYLNIYYQGSSTITDVMH